MQRFTLHKIKKIKGRNSLCNSVIFALAFIGLGVSLFAQTVSSANVIGTWKHEKEGLMFQFNADNTFTLGEESEAARQAAEQEQHGQGERLITSVSGTYTVNDSRVEMLMLVDEKTHKVRMTWKLIDANTLRLDGQNYRKIIGN